MRRLDAPQPTPDKPRVRALEVGAGIGRVTSTALLYMIDDVVLLEPIRKFVEKAKSDSSTWRGIKEGKRSVTFLCCSFLDYDPSKPVDEQTSNDKLVNLGRVGFVPPADIQEDGYDVIWCQWCLGHLNDDDLVAFFQRCIASIRVTDGKQGMIVVKENVCADDPDGGPSVTFDEVDSSITRSNQAWLRVFQCAGLHVIREEIQLGLPEGLFMVKMYALE
jgi:protein N-terminal methyltransferase